MSGPERERAELLTGWDVATILDGLADGLLIMHEGGRWYAAVTLEDGSRVLGVDWSLGLAVERLASAILRNAEDRRP